MARGGGFDKDSKSENILFLVKGAGVWGIEVRSKHKEVRLKNKKVPFD